MTRPEDIPERVWTEADVMPPRSDWIAFDDYVLRKRIARAILAAEKRVREECVADARQAWLDGIPVAEIWLAIRARGAARAAAIRKGGEDASQRPMNPTASAGTGVHGARWHVVPADQDKGGEDA